MYFKNENGEKIKENFALSEASANTGTPKPDDSKESNKCQDGFKFDGTTIALLIALLIVAVLLWKYDDIFPKEGGSGGEMMG